MRWLPTSKMTAVGVSGAVYTWAIWVLDRFYDTALEPLVVAANQTWVMFLIGYAVTEQRPRADA